MDVDRKMFRVSTLLSGMLTTWLFAGQQDAATGSTEPAPASEEVAS
jgi:hypothetical protein